MSGSTDAYRRMPWLRLVVVAGNSPSPARVQPTPQLGVKVCQIIQLHEWIELRNSRGETWDKKATAVWNQAKILLERSVSLSGNPTGFGFLKSSMAMLLIARFRDNASHPSIYASSKHGCNPSVHENSTILCNRTVEYAHVL